MNREEELEKLTVQFLRENDPFFYKKKKLEYMYLSEKMSKTRASKEIPASNLSKRQKQRCPKMSDTFEWEDFQ